MENESMEKKNNNIGARLRIARGLAGFRSAREFTLKHSIPASTYSQHETGKRALSIELLLYYCELLNVSPLWLMTGNGSPQPNDLLLHAKKLSEALTPSSTEGSTQANRQKTIVDAKLIATIFERAISLLPTQHAANNSGELVRFCFDIYDNVLELDEKSQKNMIDLSMRSFMAGVAPSREEAIAV